ncbi:hypothetical protein RB623_05090 [Mesorhizobium sp. LHD-90]|uniref:hypothetical protein n=1 Tax=Mesorhizobium sp. LHD-90 TaxID=3071414 RepID=UPI0027DFD724|nr:hypothetical protein [Mesorhizobium sp. LHD-90]MDQ6433424.1 hypothetical protein [Mesorhizobium sp. LHD-90]
MERSPAIDKNWEALKRLLAMLVGMAEMAGGAPTLPRHLHRAIMRLLRPAESAARRLIIAAARGIVVTLPPFRPRKPKEPAIRRGPRAFMPTGPKKRPNPVLRALTLSLLDPLKNPFRIRRRYVPAHALPRIRSLADDSPYRPLPQPPSPDDPIDAARLGQRLEALGRALDDLPGQAKRFARWKARRDAAVAREKPSGGAGGQGGQDRGAVRFRRVSPLRRGRPPGGRLSRYDPTATHPRNIREIDEILAHANALAVYALETPDTS